MDFGLGIAYPVGESIWRWGREGTWGGSPWGYRGGGRCGLYRVYPGSGRDVRKGLLWTKVGRRFPPFLAFSPLLLPASAQLLFRKG